MQYLATQSVVIQSCMYDMWCMIRECSTEGKGWMQT